MQVIASALRMIGGFEYGAIVDLKEVEPAPDVGGVTGRGSDESCKSVQGQAAPSSATNSSMA